MNVLLSFNYFDLFFFQNGIEIDNTFLIFLFFQYPIKDDDSYHFPFLIIWIIFLFIIIMTILIIITIEINMKIDWMFFYDILNRLLFFFFIYCWWPSRSLFSSIKWFQILVGRSWSCSQRVWLRLYPWMTWTLLSSFSKK